MLKVFDRSFEHLVLAGPDSGECRSHFDNGLQSDALKLSSIGVPHALAAEAKRISLRALRDWSHRHSLLLSRFL